MEPRHVASACALLNAYLERRTRLHPIYTPAEFAHWLLPRPGVIDTFVLEKAPAADASAPPCEEVTDFISFYSLPSTVIGEGGWVGGWVGG